MHHHGHLWTGPKERFGNEALRRPPHPDPPPAPVSGGDVPAERLLKRYRDVAAEFPASDPPPIETAYWLVKPRSLVRGSWDDTQEAAVWPGRRPAEYAPRFAAAAQRDAGHLTALVGSARERPASGGDVSLGFCLERPSYLSLAIVTCSPHRERGDLPCPLSA
ncbi:hypothetical protein ACQ4WX_22865 [Streptomyces lasalocidi]